VSASGWPAQYEIRVAGGLDGRWAAWFNGLQISGEGREPDFRVLWADRPEYSHLTTSDRLRTAIATSGFEIEPWNDLTGQAAAMMQTLLTLPPSPIGLQVFVPGFWSKAKNLTAALADGRLRAVQGVARAV